MVKIQKEIYAQDEANVEPIEGILAPLTSIVVQYR